MATSKTLAKPTGKNEVVEQDVAAGLRTIRDELSLQFFDRRLVIEVILITMLARLNGLLIGPPGTAKTELLRAIMQRILGSKFKYVLLGREMGEERLFGQYDMPLYDKEGRWRRKTANTLFDAHSWLLDEVGKAGSGILNALLTALNEHVYDAGEGEEEINLLSAWAATNEFLEPALAAVYDRLVCRLMVGYMQDPADVGAYLSSRTTPVVEPVRTVITLEGLQDAIFNKVPAIKVPPAVVQQVTDLRFKLHNDGVMVSDRRMGQAIRLMQANAFFNGRDVVDDDDITILEHVLWDRQDERQKVQEAVLKASSELTTKALDIAQQCTEIARDAEAAKGTSIENRSNLGGELNPKLTDLSQQIETIIAQAQAEGRSTARYETVQQQITATRVKVYVVCFNAPEESTAKRFGLR